MRLFHASLFRGFTQASVHRQPGGPRGGGAGAASMRGALRRTLPTAGASRLCTPPASWATWKWFGSCSRGALRWALRPRSDGRLCSLPARRATWKWLGGCSRGAPRRTLKVRNSQCNSPHLPVRATPPSSSCSAPRTKSRPLAYHRFRSCFGELAPAHRRREPSDLVLAGHGGNERGSACWSSRLGESGRAAVERCQFLQLGIVERHRDKTTKWPWGRPRVSAPAAGLRAERPERAPPASGRAASPLPASAHSLVAWLHSPAAATASGYDE